MLSQRCNCKDIAVDLAYKKETAMDRATSGGLRRPSNCHQPSVTIVPEDSIQIEKEASVDCVQSRQDSCWSLHCDRIDQAPYTLSKHAGETMTSTTLLGLPRESPSADLAFFFRTTGPVAPHCRPSKAEHRPSSGVVIPAKKALRFLKLWPGQSKKKLVAPYDRFEDTLILWDEGGLLMDGVEQRQTSSGQKYLFIVPKLVEEESEELKGQALGRLSEESADKAPALSLDILESSISISIEDDDDWFSTMGSNYSQEIERPYSPARPRYSLASLCEPSARLSLRKDTTAQTVDYSSPVRPRASNPPTPQPESAISVAALYCNDLPDHPAEQSFDTCRAPSSHAVEKGYGLPVLPKVPIALPKEKLPLKVTSLGREVEIEHPSPRRFASHPVLLQRASSTASSLYPRSFSDSPGPPPPRSPLRLGRDLRTIEGIIADHPSIHSQKAEPRVAPEIEPVAEYNTECTEVLAVMQPIVITGCTDPIKRPQSRCKSSLRKEREERVRSRKLRDRHYALHTIDSIVNATPSQSPTRRLRKPRPRIQIPELKPAPLVIRASPSASSITSWRKITECTRTPVSPVPSLDSPASNREKTGHTLVSLTASNGSTSAKARIALSPVMLVAEDTPAPKTKSTPKPTKLMLRDGKSYAGRPRSASIPYNALKRWSPTGDHTLAMQQTSLRLVSPMEHASKEDSLPLSSPPPNKALLSTPLASGSEKLARTRTTEVKKSSSFSPVYEILPKASTPRKRTDPLPHAVTQAQGQSVSSNKDLGGETTPKSIKIDARLVALEKQNEMLYAALVAVLETNGAVNSPLSTLAAEPDSPLGWENRVARRSAASQGASHAASSSNGSALEMYMSTRRDSKQGYGGA
ncbi:hypothetical protein LTR54_017087 [Friedmanniomyces endolithicus]|uniref:Uncharacterized protein n=1 Tax=Friedmanniomyces endolithicus TaxID=329885 RepID=A0AAN6J3G1_9PEZI|nr:hypothetical protein LTS00_016457 [Friedmanniomyces endolithicus]KAK0312303.1 hypothetical protein LTR82_013935 [Friedmanniomyces endolithicus]KAK0974452.1 hypothetical protein LTR54_017087 [Friedmanniomyces endolithicus]